MVCRALRDNFAEGCPGFFCNKCHHHGHWAKDCPEKLKCGWHGNAEHPLEECPKGGKSLSGGTKRSSAEAPSALPPPLPLKRSSTAAPAAAASSSSSSFSYASRLASSTVETITSIAIDSFLYNFKGYGNLDIESQLRRVDGQVEEERRQFQRRMAELAAKRKDIIRNQRNAVKLSNLLAQLKEAQQDLDDSSDEIDESTLSSSSTVPSSNVETVSNVEINVKIKKQVVDRDDDRASKEFQVGQVKRVEPPCTDSGGSVAGTHPVSAVTDTAGVSDIGSSAVPGSSVASIHPVSAAAGGSDRMVDAARTLGNSSRRTSSSSSPDRNSQSSKQNVKDTEVIEHLDLCVFGYFHKRGSSTVFFVNSITISTSALNCYTVERTCYLVSCYAVATCVIATEADFAHIACE